MKTPYLNARALALGLALLGAACTYNPAVAPGSLLCGENEVCPEGFECRPGYNPAGGAIKVCCKPGEACGDLRKDPGGPTGDGGGATDAPKTSPKGDGGADHAGSEPGGNDGAIRDGTSGPVVDGSSSPSDGSPAPVDARLEPLDMAKPLDAPAVDSPVDRRPDLPVDLPIDVPNSPGCPASKGGPALKAAGSFCIDATEVTNAQYEDFLDAKVPLPPDDDPTCRWNDTYQPGSSRPWPAPADKKSHPVVAVDWCDAYAFCRWAGKTLCTKAQHTSACSHGGERTYPYEGGYKEGVCNAGHAENADDNDNYKNVKAVQSSTCLGGYAGVFDLSGNVEEWLLDCASGNDSSKDLCPSAGGMVFSGRDLSKCGEAGNEPRADRWMLRGFRCCAK